jgi:Ribulose bisphosphate carboxylase large chain, catalytic domain
MKAESMDNIEYPPLPSGYLRPAGEHPLVEPALVQEDYVRFKIRLAFSSSFCSTFEEGAERLLDEIGPRPGTHPSLATASPVTALIQCDAEESSSPEARRGVVEFGVSSREFPDRTGLPLAIALASYVSAFSFILEYQVMDIQFPYDILCSDTLPGPKFGPALLPGQGSAGLGVIIKPRFISDLEFLREFVTDVGGSGIDYLTDDELTVASRDIPFRVRVEEIVAILRRIEQLHGSRPVYIANIAGDYEGAMERAEVAKEIGADAVMVNYYAMGYDVMGALARDQKFNLGIVANGMGLGVLTKGPLFRVSTELICRLARLAGADAVYTGPMVGLIDSSRHSAAQFRRALTQPYGRNCSRRMGLAMMSGGIGLPELLRNDALYRGPLCLSMGYQFSEPRLRGMPAPVIVECIRTVWEAVRSGGLDEGRVAVQLLAKKGKHYKDCLVEIRAEEAVSK